MTTEWLLFLVAGAVIGAALGGLFFGGLWWTAQRLSTSRPGLLLASSYVGRVSAMAISLVVLASLHPALLMGALAGFIVARTIWVRAARDSDRLQPIRITSDGKGPEADG